MSTSTEASRRTGPTLIDELTEANATLVKNWWLIALRGVLAVIFGVIAFVAPFATILALVILFSAYMVVDSVFSFFAAYRAWRSGGRWGLLTLQGLASLAAGGVALIWPGITVTAFVVLIGAWMIVTGCLLLATAIRADSNHGRFWLWLVGALSLLYGFLMVLAPLLGAVVLTWWLGAFALFFGVLLLVVAFRLRARRSDRPDRLTTQPVT